MPGAKGEATRLTVALELHSRKVKMWELRERDES